MKLPKNALIEKATSSDANRPALNQVYLEKQDNGRARLLATNGSNGFIMAVLPVLADPEDTNGYIPESAFKAARKSVGKLSSVEFTANVVCKMPDGQTFSRTDLGKYPNIDQVIPKGDVTHSISFDPQLLWDLAQAIGAERGVTIQCISGTQALRVVPIDNPRAKTPKGSKAGYVMACADAFGVIMPINAKKE